MPTERVDILFEAQSAAQAASQIDKVDDALDDVADSGKRAGSAMDSMGVAIGTFAGGAALGIAGGAKDFAVDFAQDSFEAAKQQEAAAGVWNIATAKFGINADEARARMAALSEQTLSDTQIMLMGAQALELGAASSLEELENLYRIAQSRQGLTGGTIEQAFGDVVTGVGRQSLQILDNLGISTSAMSAGMEEYAASIGSTVKELDDVAKKQAFLHAVNTVALPTQEEFASSFGEMETAVAQYGAAMDDAKAAFGALFGPAAAQALTVAAGAMNEFLAASPDASIGDQIAQQEKNVARLIDQINELNSKESSAPGIIGDAIDSLNQGAGGAQLYTQQLIEAQELLDELYMKQHELNAAQAEQVGVAPEMVPAFAEEATVAPPPMDEDAIAAEALKTATTMAEGITEQLEAEGVADDILAVLEEGLADQEERLMAVGEAAGDDFANGFLASVAGLSSAVIDAVANQVTPIVASRLADDGSRTGAGA